MRNELSLYHLLVGAILCIGIALGADKSVRAEDPSQAFDFYLEFLKTSAEAQSFDEIAPFMPVWWRTRYESTDEATKASAFEWKVKQARDLHAITLEKAEAKDGGVRLHMTAKEQNDFPMTGEVLLVGDSGNFVVAEEVWTMSQ